MKEYKSGLYFIKTNIASGGYIIGKLLRISPIRSDEWDIEVIKIHNYHIGSTKRIICPTCSNSFVIETFSSIPKLMAKVI